MNVSAAVWVATVAAVVVVVAADFIFAARSRRPPSLRQAGLWTTGYVLLAVAFGIGVVVLEGGQRGGEFFAGWLTEYSLSVDNLFVFVIILTRFAVPAGLQQRVLLIGIALALLMRAGFIAAGAAVIERFSWVFYIFGVFLVVTAVRLARHRDSDAAEGAGALRLVNRLIPSTSSYDGTRLFTRVDGRRLATPLLVVMVALAVTDLIFALDSIPAIFGLTEEPYLVFTANAFALLGLRQLYFLLGGLLDRLVYLSAGLAAILGFIGVKLVLEALHDNSVGFINGGEHVTWAPAIPIWVSLLVVATALGVATAASLLRPRYPRTGGSV